MKGEIKMFMTSEEKYLEVIKELGEAIRIKNYTTKQLEDENYELKKKVEELTK